MHRLDSCINDIEPRIKAIYAYTPKQEESSLQQSLSSYGWILLDSWIAWRTLRFLLRETKISDDVHSKWFQTPSSYTASQLRAVWHFSQSTIEYLEIRTGKNFRDLIDRTIQEKRNSSAHFTQNNAVLGTDSQEIKEIYKTLSRVFLFYETGNFISVVCDKLALKGYSNFRINYTCDEIYTIDTFLDTIKSYSKCDEFALICNNNDESEYVIQFKKDGCEAGSVNAKTQELHLQNVMNEEQSVYCFWSNKGFYRDVELFVSTIITCWNNP